MKSFVFIVMVWGDSDTALAGVFGTEAAALQHIRAIDSAETPAEHCHVEQWELAGARHPRCACRRAGAQAVHFADSASLNTTNRGVP